jgi:hypothetical protein
VQIYILTGIFLLVALMFFAVAGMQRDEKHNGLTEIIPT